MSVLACLLLLLAPEPVDRLKDTLKQYAKQPYEQRRRSDAIRALGRIGSPASTRALEGMLADPFAHLRDEAVSALIQLKRKGAAERRESLALLGDFLKRRGRTETRIHLATALREIGDPYAVPWLVDALHREKDPAAVAALARALGRLGGDAARAALELKARRLPAGRAACVRAMAGFDYAGEYVLRHADDPDPAVKAAVVDVLVARTRPVLPRYEVDAKTGAVLGIALADALSAHRDRARARRRAAALLQHRSWRVRAAAIAGVEAMRDPTLLGDLVDCLAREEGRLRADAWNALRRLTRREIPPDPAQWRVLLPQPELPDAAGRGDAGLPKTTVAYFGLPVFSRRLAFVFDVSGSMRDDGKIEAARKQFRRTAAGLAPTRRYDLFVYRYYLDYPPRPRLERAFGKLVAGKAKAAAKWLGKQEAKGGGALYDALVAAMDDPEVDTIYLLSDGVPSYGTVARDWRIRREIAARNRWRRVVIHTILLGTRRTDAEFMRRLAAESGGVAVDAAGKRLR